jgi:hypothetical protein
VVASVARFLAKTLGLLVENVGDVCLGEKGEDGDEADSGEDCETAPRSAERLESAKWGCDLLVRTQKIQRQLVPVTYMYPEMMGARAGPAKGIKAKMARASPRWSGPQRSAMTPPELVRGAAAKVPPRKRKTMRLPTFGAAKGEMGVSSAGAELSEERRTESCSNLEAEVRDPAANKDETTTVTLGERSPHCERKARGQLGRFGIGRWRLTERSNTVSGDEDCTRAGETESEVGQRAESVDGCLGGGGERAMQGWGRRMVQRNGEKNSLEMRRMPTSSDTL